MAITPKQVGRFLRFYNKHKEGLELNDDAALLPYMISMFGKDDGLEVYREFRMMGYYVVEDKWEKR